MKQGEVARFTLISRVRPNIPANATLVLEVELLNWVSKDDLFNDGGVIKSVLKEGWMEEAQTW